MRNHILRILILEKGHFVYLYFKYISSAIGGNNFWGTTGHLILC